MVPDSQSTWSRSKYIVHAATSFHSAEIPLIVKMITEKRMQVVYKDRTARKNMYPATTYVQPSFIKWCNCCVLWAWERKPGVLHWCRPTQTSTALGSLDICRDTYCIYSIDCTPYACQPLHCYIVMYRWFRKAL